MSADVPSSPGVCVLGMSRSGTSLTARLLSLVGVYLGQEEELLGEDLRQLQGEGDEVLARAREANPDGFFEHYRITRLNERILRALGGNWREPPPMPAGWELSESVAAERADARALLEESFDGRRTWGWKDPRNSLTPPLWQSIAPSMRYVVCLRNPIDVAASLQRRDGIPFERAIDLWTVYVASALVNTAGRPRLLVPYESYFRDPGEVSARLVQFARSVVNTDDARDWLVEAADERLWRNRSSRIEATRNLPPEAASLYLLTETLAAAAPEGDAGGERDGLHAAIDEYAERLLERLSLPDGARTV